MIFSHFPYHPIIEVISYIMSTIFYHLFFSSLKNSPETLLKHLMKTRDLMQDRNLKENIYHWISQLIQYFSIELYSQLVSFYGNIFSPFFLFWKVLWIEGYIWNFLHIKCKKKISKGQWAQIAQAHNKSIYHFSLSQEIRFILVVSLSKHIFCLEEEVWYIREF